MIYEYWPCCNPFDFSVCTFVRSMRVPCNNCQSQKSFFRRLATNIISHSLSCMAKALNPCNVHSHQKWVITVKLFPSNLFTFLNTVPLERNRHPFFGDILIGLWFCKMQVLILSYFHCETHFNNASGHTFVSDAVKAGWTKHDREWFQTLCVSLLFTIFPSIGLYVDYRTWATM